MLARTVTHVLLERQDLAREAWRGKSRHSSVHESRSDQVWIPRHNLSLSTIYNSIWPSPVFESYAPLSLVVNLGSVVCNKTERVQLVGQCPKLQTVAISSSLSIRPLDLLNAPSLLLENVGCYLLIIGTHRASTIFLLAVPLILTHSALVCQWLEWNSATSKC